MHRVVTKRFDHRGNWIVEKGPWHQSRHDAENWATILRGLGYNAQVESLMVDISMSNQDSDLHDALANMA